MEPENAPLEKETHLPTTNFGIPCLFSGVTTKYLSFGQTPSQSSNTYYPLLLQLQIEPVSPEEKGTQYLVRLLPRKLTISLENRMKLVFQPPFFRNYISFREGNFCVSLLFRGMQVPNFETHSCGKMDNNLFLLPFSQHLQISSRIPRTLRQSS